MTVKTIIWNPTFSRQTAKPGRGSDLGKWSASLDMLKWKFNSSQSVFASPVFSPDHSVVYSASLNTLFALNASTGEPSWTYYFKDEVNALSVNSDTGTIYVSNMDFNLYAVSSTGVVQLSSLFLVNISKIVLLDRMGLAHAVLRRRICRCWLRRQRLCWFRWLLCLRYAMLSTFSSISTNPVRSKR